MTSFQQRRRSNSPFPPQCNHSPLPLIINLLLNLGAEANGAHDTVTKLLIQHRLEGVAVVLDNLKESVDEWFLWWHVQSPPPIGPRGQLLSEGGLVDGEEGGEGLDVLGGSLGLAIEEGGYGDFVAPDFLADGLEGEVLFSLCLEESGRGGRKAGDERGLYTGQLLVL
jgi:hypothetical protein